MQQSMAAQTCCHRRPIALLEHSSSKKGQHAMLYVRAQIRAGGPLHYGQLLDLAVVSTQQLKDSRTRAKRQRWSNPVGGSTAIIRLGPGRSGQRFHLSISFQAKPGHSDPPPSLCVNLWMSPRSHGEISPPPPVGPPGPPPARQPRFYAEALRRGHPLHTDTASLFLRLKVLATKFLRQGNFRIRQPAPASSARACVARPRRAT